MAFGPKVFAGLCTFALGLLIAAPSAAATTYTVDANPYSASGVVRGTGNSDAFVLDATSGTAVAYSVAAAGDGCVIVELTGGDWTLVAVGLQGSEGCVSSYSNTFPVNSSGWTEFLVEVSTTQMTDVAYTVTISVQTSTSVLIPLALVGVIALVAIAWIVRARRKAARER